MLILWMLGMTMGRSVQGSVEIFNVSPAEQSGSQEFTATKMYGDTSEFYFTGTFISTSASTVLYIGDPLDGSFDDNNNRGYKIEIHNFRIDIWPNNPKYADGKNTHFKKDGQNEDYVFANGELMEFTLKIQQNGNIVLSELKGNPSITLTFKTNTFTFTVATSDWKDKQIKLELVSNNNLVFSSVRATSEGSTDEENCQAGHMKTGDGQCQSCTEGTYGTDGLECLSCPDSSTSVQGATSISQCICLANHYKNSDQCQPCPATSTSNQGATSVVECKCPKDRYMKNEQCHDCPGGGTTSVQGATSVAECRCPADHYLENETCKTCPGGQKSEPGSTSLSDCKQSDSSLTPGF
ncbi:hypothetical protein ACHWQZ_G007384 [Mnemiopsis leidyi]